MFFKTVLWFLVTQIIFFTNLFEIDKISRERQYRVVFYWFTGVSANNLQCPQTDDGDHDDDGEDDADDKDEDDDDEDDDQNYRKYIALL